MNKYKLKVHGSSSKRLLGDVTQFVGEIITEFSILWEREKQRDQILDVIDEYLEEIVEDGRITRYNVICDDRNNNDRCAARGITHLDVHYKQDNCYNTTKLHYTISDTDE